MQILAAPIAEDVEEHLEREARLPVRRSGASEHDLAVGVWPDSETAKPRASSASRCSVRDLNPHSPLQQHAPPLCFTIGGREEGASAPPPARPTPRRRDLSRLRGGADPAAPARVCPLGQQRRSPSPLRRPTRLSRHRFPPRRHSHTCEGPQLSEQHTRGSEPQKVPDR
jgi:hypothetical protein